MLTVKRMPHLLYQGKIWSPYTPNKLFFYGNGLYDTLNDGHTTTLFNHYFFDLELNKAVRITPSKFGSGTSSGFGIASWLKGSTNERDSLLGGVGQFIYHKTIYSFNQILQQMVTDHSRPFQAMRFRCVFIIHIW